MTAWWIDADPCPDWCVSQHRSDDFPEDRVHESAGRIAPAEVPDGAERPESTDVAVVAYRRAGSSMDYLSVGTGPDNEFRVALPCGPAVLEAVATVLRQVKP